MRHLSEPTLGKAGRRVLLVSPCGTHPTFEGNRRRVLTIATQLQAQGHEVHLAVLPNTEFSVGDVPAMRAHWGQRLHMLYPATSWSWGYRLRRQIARRASFVSELLGMSAVPHVPEVDTFYLDWWNLELALLQRRFRFDVVFAEYVFVSRAFGAFPLNVLKVIDTHDIFSGRDEAIRSATGLSNGWLATSAINESAGLARADLVLAIQADEANHLRTMTTKAVLTVGHFVERQAVASPEPAVAPRLLFVGSESAINVHGIAWFVKNVLPTVLQRNPEVRLRIVGKVAMRLRAEIGDAMGIDLVGPVEDLAAEYALAALVINPVQFGTGLAIKAIEALSYGKALVCTSQGARGIAGLREDDSPVQVADAPGDLADRITCLLRDSGARRMQEQRAIDFLRVWNDQQASSLTLALSQSPQRPGHPSGR